MTKTKSKPSKLVKKLEKKGINVATLSINAREYSGLGDSYRWAGVIISPRKYRKEGTCVGR